MTKEEAREILKSVKEKGFRYTMYKLGQFNAALDMAIKALTYRDDFCGWIPVSERLPEDGTWNLFTDGKNVSVERYKSDAIDHFNPNGRWFSLEEAVAWMPIPEPYKAESETQE